MEKDYYSFLRLDKDVESKTRDYQVYLYDSGFNSLLNEKISDLALWKKTLEIGNSNKIPDLNHIFLTQIMDLTKDVMKCYGIDNPNLMIKDNNLYLDNKSLLLLNKENEINNIIKNYVNKEKPNNPIIMTFYDLRQQSLNIKWFFNDKNNLQKCIGDEFDEKTLLILKDNRAWKDIAFSYMENEYVLINRKTNEKVKVDGELIQTFDIYNVSEKHINLYNVISDMIVNNIQDILNENKKEYKVQFKP